MADLNDLSSRIDEGLSAIEDGGDPVTPATPVVAAPEAAPTPPAEPAVPPPAPLPSFAKKDAKPEVSPTPASPEASKPLDLSKYSDSYLNMLKKFVQGGEIKTEADLQTAQQKAGEDYWRNQTRLAELAKEKEIPSPSAAPTEPSPVSVPPELALYDQGLADLQTKGRVANSNIEGWGKEISRINSEIKSLQTRKSRGDTTLDPDDLVHAFQERDAANAQLSNWQGHFETLREQNNALLHRKSEATSLLDVRSRLDRQAQEQEVREDTAAQKAFLSDFDSTLTASVTEFKVAEEDRADLREIIRSRAYMQAGVKPFAEGELKPFISGLVKGYVDRINANVTKAVAGYTKTKVGDAPKIPTTKARVATEKGRTQAPNMRALEQAVMDADLDS